MKVIVGDPATGDLEDREFPENAAGFFEACRSFIGARYIETTRLDSLRKLGPVLAWVDEEGLLKPENALWSPVGGPGWIAGRFVLSGVSETGEAAALMPPLAQIAPEILMQEELDCIDFMMLAFRAESTM